jgi:hypothetical protein
LSKALERSVSAEKSPAARDSTKASSSRVIFSLRPLS